MSTPSKSPRHAYPTAPFDLAVEPHELARAIAGSFVRPGEPLRSEDAAWVCDFERVVDGESRVAELSRAEHLEMILVTSRAIARAEALKREILARLKAQSALPAQARQPVGG